MKVKYLIPGMFLILLSCERADLLTALQPRDSDPLVLTMTQTQGTLSKSASATTTYAFSAQKNITGTFSIFLDNTAIYTIDSDISLGNPIQYNLSSTPLNVGRHLVVLEAQIQGKIFRQNFELFITP